MTSNVGAYTHPDPHGDDVLPRLATPGLHPRIPGLSMNCRRLQWNLTGFSCLIWNLQFSFL
jgi:hypothetical protein